MEKKYPNQLVVIGIHTAKFDNEKDSRSIKKAMARYELHHPVINDADQKIWNAYGVASWPTVYLIDPEGNVAGVARDEHVYAAADREIARLIQIHRKQGTLNERPLQFLKESNPARTTSPLFFPGKVLADEKGKRLFIADSTHHRIVITDLEGKKIAIAGTGQSGKVDGPFDRASFCDPQGLALVGDTLYVADRGNNLIRALDLHEKTVKTIAGTGRQGHDVERGGAALLVGLNSPWGLLAHGQMLYIAMAGHHQIWMLDLKRQVLRPLAGTGMEDIRDGELRFANFAQPSGLATDGETLYVADSEVSAIRAVPLTGGMVRTLVGEGLFVFGDVDGVGREVRLQHALGVAFHDGKLYVADTYNSKIKVLNPRTRECTTLIGGRPKGKEPPVLDEPGGLSYAGGKLYVADTNAHRIRVIDLATKAISTLKLEGVEPPRAASGPRK